MTQKVELKRELGLLEVTLAGVGIILGAGIYALIGKAAGLTGNSVWLSFAISALVAVFTGLSYAELSSMFPKASAEYEYTSNAFGKKLAFIIGWLIILSAVIGASTVALGFGGYFNAFFKVSSATSGFFLIIALSFLLFYGIKESAWFAIISTLIETAGLLIVIFIGLPYFGKVDYFDMPLGLPGVFQAAALVFFAYTGFESIAKLSEETKAPEKTIPKGLILSIIISIILYVLVAISAVSVVGWEKLASSQAPFAELAYAVFGSKGFILLSVIALFATANTVLMMLLGSSRIMYGMADSSTLPNILARVHPSRRTPWVAILITMILSLLFIFAGDIAFVANVDNFTLFVTFFVINAAMIVLRYKEPDLRRPFMVPLSIGKFPVLPLFGILFCIFMISQLELKVLLTGIILVVLGGLFSLVEMKKG
ncbi:MAG: amino acid permease [Candidatus Methanoperedens sp.]|nr:amino acid permease [Candidatus Methanoperedens sp.]MCZ7371896.1 amino acid permease [Candidatus Methanoperedens sp.]